MYDQGRVLVFNKNGIPIGQIFLPRRDVGHNLESTSMAIKPNTNDLYIVTNNGKRRTRCDDFSRQSVCESPAALFAPGALRSNEMPEGSMNGSFKGKVAFITGAANGIGRTAALAFAREGANVVIADVAEQGNQETARLIEEAGGRALAVGCDVSRAGDMKAALEKAVEAFGRLDFAFNNAGIEQPVKPAADSRRGVGPDHRHRPARRVPLHATRDSFDAQARGRCDR